MSDTLRSKTSRKKKTSPSLHYLAELQRRRFLTPNVAVCLRSSLCSPLAPASPPSSPSCGPPAPLSLLPFLPLPSPSAVAFSSFTAVTANPTAFLLRDAVAGSSANFATAAVSFSHGPHSSPSPSASSPSSSTRRSLLPNSPSQQSTSASSFSSVSFSTPQRPSHRRLRSLFPDGLSSSVSPASTPSIVGRILLLRRRSLLPPWPGSCRLPPLVPPSRENASSVPASQSSVNPVVADARSSLPPFSSLSSAAPRLHHCRRGEDCVDLLRRGLPLRPRHRSLSFMVCGFCSPF